MQIEKNLPSANVVHHPEQLKKLWVFYHYFFPDDVVSASIMSQFCQGMDESGWQVTAFPSNRSWREDDPPYAADTEHHGTRIKRIWRPRFRQSSSAGRLLNAVWMIAAWSLLALEDHPPDTIVIGTDPILSVLTALVWKRFQPGTRIVHWCFDLYPEAAFADGVLSPISPAGRVVKALVHHAYQACDAIVDLGPCMRGRLAAYGASAQVDTVVPWALDEPLDVLPSSMQERLGICGPAKLALLYSGSFGRAHIYEDFLLLAKALRGESATMTFSVRGNRKPDLRAAVECLSPKSTCEIRFVPFAPAERLLDRLAAPDVHLLSLAHDWSGLVIPSKFFGALAVGRPVLFSGSPDSSIARWIVQYNLGWILTANNAEAVAKELRAYVSDPAGRAAMQRRCFDTYHALFSKRTGLGRMRKLIEHPQG